MDKLIPFNKPFIAGNELEYIRQAVDSGKISGDGKFTEKCQSFFESKYKFGKCLLTTSCTDALEMAAILINLKPGDEVIIPSYTFVSTANAFVMHGAKVIFADSLADNPNVDPDSIEKLITPNTKAIVAVHYAGVACDMDRIKKLADKHKLLLIEDAAQAIDSYYNDQPLGSIGHLSAFSFHETKNIISGEGGMLVINDREMIKRAEVIREKGTNRSQFFRGEVDKYGWVDIGSSFLPSEIVSAFLYAQLEKLDTIQAKRKEHWDLYSSKLSVLEEKGYAVLPKLPSYATNNAHMFYLVCRNLEERSKLIKYLKEQNVYAVFHYLSLNKSPYYSQINSGAVTDLPNSDRYTDCLVRIPMFYELKRNEIDHIVSSILRFYGIR